MRLPLSVSLLTSSIQFSYKASIGCQQVFTLALVHNRIWLKSSNFMFKVLLYIFLSVIAGAYSCRNYLVFIFLFAFLQLYITNFQARCCLYNCRNSEGEKLRYTITEVGRKTLRHRPNKVPDPIQDISCEEGQHKEISIKSSQATVR